MGGYMMIINSKKSRGLKAYKFNLPEFFIHLLILKKGFDKPFINSLNFLKPTYHLKLKIICTF